MARLTKYKKFLRANGITQKDVVTGTGIAKSHVSLVSNGYCNFKISTLKKLCQYHNCSPNDILDWEPWQEEAANKKLKK